MSLNHLRTLQWQFEMTWRLADIHLAALTDGLCLWEPVAGCWTVRKSEDGLWRPDWAEPEPNPAPPVTIAWLTWQVDWWWSGALAATRNERPLAHHQVVWPGNAGAIVQRLKALATQWATTLSGLGGDLERPLTYPWSEPRPLRLSLAWVNSELMKNVAEIGYIRHLFEASRGGR
jgi:DinB superfamily